MTNLAELSRRMETEPWVEILNLDNGCQCPIYMPKNAHERIAVETQNCKFTPVGYAFLDGAWYPLSYKVVRCDLKSLGLRKNPNIMTFPIGDWVILDGTQVKEGNGDWGGIWTALRKGNIKTLKQHCQTTHGMETRAFLTAIYNPVYANSYRIKSQGVILLKEILPDPFV